MRLRVLGIIVGAALLAATPALGGNGHGNGPGPKTCTPEDLATIHDAIMAACPCDTAKNHGQFVSCSSHVLGQAMKGGTLSRECRRLARRGVAKSSCGKPGFVTCCRSDVPAAAACVVRRDAATCTAAGGCVGSTSTCMDACATPCASPSGAFLDDTASSLF